MEKTKSFVLTTEVHLSYDEDSVEFKSSLRDFSEAIRPLKGTPENMLEHVAYAVAKDPHKIIPHIGYVRLNGRPEDPDSGIKAVIDPTEIEIL